MKDEGKVNSLINPARLMSLDGGSRQFPGSANIVEITRDNSRDLPSPETPIRKNGAATPLPIANYSLSASPLSISIIHSLRLHAINGISCTANPTQAKVGD